MTEYSARWRETFGEPDAARTAAEIRFLTEVLPLPEFERVLDVPCGTGRHLHALGSLGYRVMGADSDPAAAARAGADAVVCDLRELDSLPSGYDAVINMWASFGWFGPKENERILGSLARRLRRGGRLVLDVHNRAFFESREGERELRPGIVERSTMIGDRRRCELDYGDGERDVFEWQLYLPEELHALGLRQGLEPLLTVSSPERPAMQLVLARA
ncbi:MAG: class I SAM-dependent methyltransferase [Actinobacteria bacterium]|nr:class I SAM-dependent methyltransferase [Actinomycetota bacterium]